MSDQQGKSSGAVEPPEHVRQWVQEVLGLSQEEHRARTPLALWAALGPALAAVHEATFPPETEPATLLVVPVADEPRSAGGAGGNLA